MTFHILLVGLVLVIRANAQDDLNPLLEPIRAEQNAPALGAVVLLNGETKALGAVGTRVAKGRKKVTNHDKWHIGSCTKSMTATLIAVYVEQGLLSWDTTVGEVLGKKMKIHPAYQDATVRDLLSHRSGIRGEVPRAIWEEAWKQENKGDVRDRRVAFLEEMLVLPPEPSPRTTYQYSNTGYITAGVMLEVLTKKKWEDLMERRLFKPLEMKSSGFGAAATGGRDNQPWGHHHVDKPQEPGLGDDNPSMLGPAGTVHGSLSDLTRYVAMHLLRETGPVIKKEETYDALHAVVGNDQNYGLGWGVTEQGWAKGKVLSHHGSNTMNYCVFRLAPEKKFAAIVVSNVGGMAGEKVCEKAVEVLTEMYGD